MDLELFNLTGKEIEERLQANRPCSEKGGLYAIKVDDEIVYIGQAFHRNVNARLADHIYRILHYKESLQKYRDHINKTYYSSYVYKMIDRDRDDGKNCSVEVLIDFNEIVPYSHSKVLNQQDVNMMEYALIQLYKPKYNVNGIKKTYLGEEIYI